MSIPNQQTDLSTITDKGELSYLLVQQQRILQATQQNCQLLEQRLQQLEKEEQEDAPIQTIAKPVSSK